ncbi:MAG: nitrogen fixation protein NifH [Chloroflexi bacterium]|nr:nitrogen fixation protein NifH [Chloroflexota bacterium]
MSTTLDWLLEKEDPSVRYFALKHLLDRDENDGEVAAARRAIMRSRPVKTILGAQQPEGYWVKPGSGYSPKYQSTVWQILFLAELGADGHNRQVRRGCDYLLAHAQAAHGGLSAQVDAEPRAAIHCLNGNLLWSMAALGFGEDERVTRAVGWLAASITGDEFDEWYASGVPGPGFRCAANDGLPCAWGAVKALRALANLPGHLRSGLTDKARRMAADLLLSRDLSEADYPTTSRVSSDWFKLGFPLSYTSDVLETLMALAEAGYGRDARLQNAVDFVLSQRGADGRWRLRHSLNGRMVIDIEAKGKPSKWVTLRALRVLRAVGVE